MPAHLCRHIKNDGTPCRAVALSSQPCCLAHRRLHRRLRRMQRPPRIPAIRLGPLQDRRAILRALTRVTRAVAAHTLNLDRADALFKRIRVASANLDLTEPPEQTGP